MLFAAVGTTLPAASCTATATAGVIAAPATALLGCTTNANFSGAPVRISMGALVAPASPVAVAASV